VQQFGARLENQLPAGARDPRRQIGLFEKRGAGVAAVEAADVVEHTSSEAHIRTLHGLQRTGALPEKVLDRPAASRDPRHRSPGIRADAALDHAAADSTHPGIGVTVDMGSEEVMR